MKITLDESNKYEIEVFTSAKELVSAAKILLETDARYAGIASFLCYQSAKQMMSAFIDLRDLELIDETGWTSDYWNTCMDSQPELDGVDDEVQLLLDCEMDSYPGGDPQESRTCEHATKIINCVEKLERALLEAEPKLKSTLLNERPSVVGVKAAGDCLVVTPADTHQQDLLDSLIGWVGSHYDSRELYDIMHGELGMSQEDTELLGFDLSDFFNHTEDISRTGGMKMT